ncbi:MAG: L-seryl-tRNA(Sec) selenium transferase [Actinobacteria bacterium]|nr:L-seryl-tRNA(Sec) selenium transferase [Actinomycetota bacterium]
MTDLSRLPQVDAVLRDPAAASIVATYGRRPFAEAVRRSVDQARERARRGGPVPGVGEVITAAAQDLAARRAGRIRRVLNATGVILHTNLGRAPLSADARAAMAEAAGYCTVEYELEHGRRGSRTADLGRLAAEACDAEAATVVNNGAGAVVLVLAALAAGREAIVSRGELVEIGGSFRLPDVMAGSGSTLREVGTTNRTRADDYRDAVCDRTGVIMKIHRSNYRIVGFVQQPRDEQIAAVAREAGVPFVHDIGSGLIRDVAIPGLQGEPSAVAALASGADLVLFSGDKLLGGPQAGIIAGRDDLVRRCAKHPLARALRIDKSRRAALEVTLEAHVRSDVPLDLPVWAMLTADVETLRDRAARLASQLGVPAREVQTVSTTGGGSLPGSELESWAVALEVSQPDELAGELRAGEPPVVGRVEGGTLLLDLRTIAPAHDDLLAEAVRAALHDHG